MHPTTLSSPAKQWRLRAFPSACTSCTRSSCVLEVHTWYLPSFTCRVHTADGDLFPQVNQTNGWPTIGAYLKFVKYPQTDTQPARSGSDVAEHLQKIYMKYLAKFDAWFVDWACKSQLGLRAMQQSGMAPHEKVVVPAVRPHPVARGPPNNRVPGAVGAKPGFVTEPASSLHPVQAVHGRPGQRQALPRSSIQQVGEQPHP